MRLIFDRIVKRIAIWLILSIALFLPFRLRILWAEKIAKLNYKKGRGEQTGLLDRFLFK